MFLYPTRTQYSLVNYIRSIGRRNHKNHPPIIHPIQLIQQSIYNSFSYLIALILSFRCQCIKLIKEDYARSRHPCSLEYFSYCLFALTHVFVEELWSFDGYEVGVCLVCYCFGYHCFATAWWSVE